MNIRQYSPKTFLRQTCPDLLLQFLESRNAARLTGDQRDVLEHLLSLPPQTQQLIEAEFRRINELSNEAGTVVLVESARLLGADWSAAFSQLKSAYDRAMWAYMTDRAIFERALNSGVIDRYESWEVRRVPPFIEIERDGALHDELAKAIKQIYAVQGRGRVCHVDSYERENPERICFFAYPEGFAEMDLGYSDTDALGREPRRPALEVVIVYRPQEGTVAVHAKGGKHVVDEIAQAFARVALKLPELPPEDEIPAFSLDILLDSTFPFPIPTDAGIEAAEIVELRCAVPGPKTTFVSFSMPTRFATRQELHQFIYRIVAQERIPVSSLHVVRATLRFVFRPIDGRSRRKVIKFDVIHPNRCTLRDDPEDQIARTCIRQWGVCA